MTEVWHAIIHWLNDQRGGYIQPQTYVQSLDWLGRKADLADGWDELDTQDSRTSFYHGVDEDEDEDE